MEDLIHGKNGRQYFTLKSGMLCREFPVHKEGKQILAVYIPTRLLYSVIIYIHKYYLHPSKTATLKEFNALYYHPFAKKAVKKICESCIICTQSRNPEKKDINVGRERSLKPLQPRESVSMDILYFPTSAKGYKYGLIVADLYSLYISFYPMKTKSSAEVAKNMRAYFSAQCPPKTVYSDNDTAFRGELETLFRTYNVKIGRAHV